MKNRRPFLLATPIIAFTLLAMSGACSQHEPGDYQGGGRTEPTSQIGPATGSTVQTDSSTPDVSVPDTFKADNSTPDTFTGQ